MKKLLSLTLCAALGLSLLAGCSSNLPKSSEAPVASQPPAAQADTLKIGLTVVSSASKSTAPEGGKAGQAQMDSTVVAVLVDANGVITDCVIDGVQTKVDFNAEGKILTDLTTLVPTKNELGADYGMGKVSSVGKEWSEQAAALADYVVGKTLPEVMGIAMDETTKPTDADLAASVTISIGGYLSAIEQAVNGAQDLGAKTGDRLGLGVDTNIAKSKNAAADADGQAQAYSIYAAASFAPDGTVTSCILDGTQTNVNFNAKGEITNDVTIPTLTKNQLKEEYDMKKASSIGKEWYEQAAAFAAYVTGKTVAEVKGVALDETGHPTGADLATSVTISVGAFQKCLEKAAG